MTKKVKSYGFQTVLVNNLTVFSFGALFSRRNIDVLDKQAAVMDSILKVKKIK